MTSTARIEVLGCDGHILETVPVESFGVITVEKMPRLRDFGVLSVKGTTTDRLTTVNFDPEFPNRVVLSLTIGDTNGQIADLVGSFAVTLRRNGSYLEITNPTVDDSLTVRVTHLRS